MERYQDKIKERLMYYLFVNTKRAIFFTILLIFLILGYLNFTGISLEKTSSWLIVLISILIFRFSIALIGSRKSENIKIYHIFLVISGLILGSVFGFFYWSFYYEMTLMQKMVVLLFLVGLTAGSSISMAASPLAFISFVVPIYTPIVVRYLFDAANDSKIIAFLIIVYMGFLLFIYIANKQMLRANIALWVKQRELNDQLKQYNQKLSVVSITDGLTNLANRRYFQERLIADWIRAKRTSLPISLMIVDLDYFKSINDHYGHLYGDECLREVGKIIAGIVKRRTDLAARYGGDEFVITLYDTELKDAEDFAKKLKLAIKEFDIKNESSPIAKQLTVTIGLATMVPAPEDDFEILFDRADKALYEGKINGRNSIFSYPVSEG